MDVTEVHSRDQWARLFATVAGDRPERIGQAVLCFAVENVPSVRRALARAAGRSLASRVKAQRELATEDGWRVDVAAREPGRRPLLVELKVWAGLTSRQVQAARKRKIGLLVVPEILREKWRRTLRGVQITTWRHLAKSLAAATDPIRVAVRELLWATDQHQLDWFKDELCRNVAIREWRAFCRRRRGRDDRWYTYYAFLNMLDRHLLEQVDGYQGGGWSSSRANGYYGYDFRVGRSRKWWWLGFSRPGGRQGLPKLYLQRQGIRDVVPWQIRFPMRAAEAASWARQEIDRLSQLP